MTDPIRIDVEGDVIDAALRAEKQRSLSKAFPYGDVSPKAATSKATADTPPVDDDLTAGDVSDRLTADVHPEVDLTFDDAEYLTYISAEIRRLESFSMLDGVTRVTDDPDRMDGDVDPDLKQRASGLYHAGTQELYVAPEEIIGETPRDRKPAPGHFSTRSNFGSVWHELGHHLIRVEHPDTTFEPGSDEEVWGGAIVSDHAEVIGREVSFYATEGGMECIAEVFAGLMAGHEYPDEIMDIHDELGGPVPPAGARDPETHFEIDTAPPSAAISAAVDSAAGVAARVQAQRELPAGTDRAVRALRRAGFVDVDPTTVGRKEGYVAIDFHVPTRLPPAEERRMTKSSLTLHEGEPDKYTLRFPYMSVVEYDHNDLVNAISIASEKARLPGKVVVQDAPEVFRPHLMNHGDITITDDPAEMARKFKQAVDAYYDDLGADARVHAAQVTWHVMNQDAVPNEVHRVVRFAARDLGERVTVTERGLGGDYHAYVVDFKTGGGYSSQINIFINPDDPDDTGVSQAMLRLPPAPKDWWRGGRMQTIGIEQDEIEALEAEWFDFLMDQDPPGKQDAWEAKARGHSDTGPVPHFHYAPDSFGRVDVGEFVAFTRRLMNGYREEYPNARYEDDVMVNFADPKQQTTPDEIEANIRGLNGVRDIKRTDFEESGKVGFEFYLGRADRPTTIIYDTFKERIVSIIIRLPKVEQDIVREDRQGVMRALMQVYWNADQAYPALPHDAEVLLAGPQGHTPHVEAMKARVDHLWDFIDRLTEEYMLEFGISGDLMDYPHGSGPPDFAGEGETLTRETSGDFTYVTGGEAPHPSLVRAVEAGVFDGGKVDVETMPVGDLGNWGEPGVPKAAAPLTVGQGAAVRMPVEDFRRLQTYIGTVLSPMRYGHETNPERFWSAVGEDEAELYAEILRGEREPGEYYDGMAMPYVEIGKDGSLRGVQEGRHRTVAAEMAGLETIPVTILYNREREGEGNVEARVHAQERTAEQGGGDRPSAFRLLTQDFGWLLRDAIQASVDDMSGHEYAISLARPSESSDFVVGGPTRGTTPGEVAVHAPMGIMDGVPDELAGEVSAEPTARESYADLIMAHTHNRHDAGDVGLSANDLSDKVPGPDSLTGPETPFDVYRAQSAIVFTDDESRLPDTGTRVDDPTHYVFDDPVSGGRPWLHIVERTENVENLSRDELVDLHERTIENAAGETPKEQYEAARAVLGDLVTEAVVALAPPTQNVEREIGRAIDREALAEGRFTGAGHETSPMPEIAGEIDRAVEERVGQHPGVRPNTPATIEKGVGDAVARAVDQINDREFTIILPKTDNSGRPIRPSVIEDFARAISDRFGGVTVYPSVAGCFIPDDGPMAGELMCEENVVVTTVRDSGDEVTFDEDVDWLHDLAEDAAERLGQFSVFTSEDVVEADFVPGEFRSQLDEDKIGRNVFRSLF